VSEARAARWAALFFVSPCRAGTLFEGSCISFSSVIKFSYIFPLYFFAVLTPDGRFLFVKSDKKKPKSALSSASTEFREHRFAMPSFR